MNLEPKNDGRKRNLRTLRATSSAESWATFRPVLQKGLESLVRAAAFLIAAGSNFVRRGLSHSFETRIGVAALLVLISAVVGYELGGRVVAAGSQAANEALDDAFDHADHAFSLSMSESMSESMPEGVDGVALESGELVAQYAPVSIDALPVHHALVSDGPIFGKTATVGQLPATFDEFTLVTRGEIAKQESLASSLRRQGVSPAAIHLVSTELRKVFDFRRSRAGDAYRLTQDADGRILDFEYSQGREESYSLAWKGTRYVASKQTEVLEPQVAKIAGVVGGSFYDAIMALGEQSVLATEFAKILAWDMDFSRHVQPGDEFSILYERMYTKGADGKGVYVRPGKILAGRYSGRSGVHTVVYYENGEGEGAYFRPDGSSIEQR